MSKSTGNLFLIKDIENWGFHPMELRYVLISGHYRQTFNFTKESMIAAGKVLHRFAALYQQLDCMAVAQELPRPNSWGSFVGIQQALLEDLNVSKALGQLHILIAEITQKIRNQSLSIKEKRDFQIGLFLTFDTLGIDLKPYYEKQSELKKRSVPSEIQELADKRWEAKKNQQWELADRLRKEIVLGGWTIKDTKTGFDLRNE